MRILKNKLSVWLLLAAFLVQTGAVFLFSLERTKATQANSDFYISTTNTYGPGEHSGATSTDSSENDEQDENHSDDVGDTVDQNLPENVDLQITSPDPFGQLMGQVRLSAEASIELDTLYFVLYGPKNKSYIARRSLQDYYFVLDTADFPNGSYYMSVEASWQNYTKSAQQSIFINNSESTEDNQTSTTTPATTSTTSSSEVDDNTPKNSTSTNPRDDDKSPTISTSTAPDISTTSTSSKTASTSTNESSVSESEYKIEFVGVEKYASRPIEIKAKSNFRPDSVNFVVTGQSTKQYPSRQAGASSYSFLLVFDENVPQATYRVSVIAKKGDKEYSETVDIKYDQKVYDEINAVDPLILEFMNTPARVSGEAKIIVTSNKAIEKVEFMVDGAMQKKFPAKSNIENTYYFIWPTTQFPDGPYEISAGAINQGQIDKKIMTVVSVKNNFDDFSDIKTRTDSTAGVENDHNQTIVIDPDEELHPECQIKGIIGEGACKRFLGLSPVCRLKGIDNEKECQEYLSLDPVCREKNYTQTQCQKYKKLPTVCRDAEIFSDQGCRTLVAKENLPKICKENAVESHEECENFILESRIPQACRDRKINKITECYTHLRSQKQDQKKSVLSSVCERNNIKDLRSCENFLEQKEIREECSDLGIENRKECNDFLFEKYGLGLCEEAGIMEISGCRSYVFNKYQKILECDHEEDWYCQNEFKNNYLGEIIEKQKKFNELKQKFSKTTLPQKISLIKEQLETQNVFPIRNDEAVVKLQLADESIIVREGSLVQTSPLVMIFDSDQDGLPDSTERRLGTDPKKKDTDGDGYDDKSEIDSGYDPRGPGELIGNPLAPIDRAIVNGLTIEHPKASGEVSEKLKVEKIDTVEDSLEEAQSYVISGQAEPNQILTLYVYSDMPVVTTVKTDQYGNWQYEFENLLEDGDHEIYVVVNDNTGKVLKKSNPLSFFVREAKATSLHDYVSAAVIDNPGEPKGMINYYLIFAFGLIGLAIFLFIFYLGFYRKKYKP